MATALKDLVEQLETAEKHDISLLQDSLRFLMQCSVDELCSDRIKLDNLKSTDAILHLVDCLVPGWTIQITGRAMKADGHWHCAIRQSSSQDDDEFVGSGKGRVLSNALVAALLSTACYVAGRS